MGIPITVNEKQVDKAKRFVLSYPQLALNIFLIAISGFFFHCYQNQVEKVSALQVERYLKSEKENEKKDEIIDMWQDLGKQSATLNRLIIKKDTPR